MPKLKKSKEPVQERLLIYANVEVEICKAEQALTAGYAKKMLGWTEEAPGEKFWADYLIADENCVKIRC